MLLFAWWVAAKFTFLEDRGKLVSQPRFSKEKLLLQTYLNATSNIVFYIFGEGNEGERIEMIKGLIGTKKSASWHELYKIVNPMLASFNNNSSVHSIISAEY